MAVEIYSEAVGLRNWAELRGVKGLSDLDPSDEASMLKFACQLGETRTIYRLSLSREIRKAFSTGPTEGAVSKLLSIGYSAAAECQDSRTYKQAILASIVIRHRMNLPVSISLMSGLFEVIARAVPSIDNDYFRYWLASLVRNNPVDALYYRLHSGK